MGPGNRGLSHELSDEDRESNSIFYSTSKDDPMATQSLVSAVHCLPVFESNFLAIRDAAVTRTQLTRRDSEPCRLAIKTG